VNKAGANQQLAQSFYCAASAIVGWGLPVASCGRVDKWSCWFLVSGFKFYFGILEIRNEQLET